jgi:phosphate starvation-inducible protein PhoH and related proteins
MSRKAARCKQDDSLDPRPINTSPPTGRSLKPRTPAQDRHLKALKSQTAVFATGPAGTGKTFVMAAYAAQQLRDNEIETLVVTRPTVEAGSRGLGYLKGTLQEKFEPWLWPFLAGFHYVLGKGYYEYLLNKAERIQVCPLQYMQGMSFPDAIVLADEFENATLVEMKMLLTRIGDGTRVFLGGDIDQSMVRDSGYLEAISKLKHANVPGIAHIEYATADVVRSEFCRRVLEAFSGVDYQDAPHGVFAP